MCNISKRLLKERKRLKKNQAEMSSIGGVAKRTYCNYESGEREPMASFFSAIAAAGADVQYILTGVSGLKDAKKQYNNELNQSDKKKPLTNAKVAEYTNLDETAQKDDHSPSFAENTELASDNQLKQSKKADTAAQLHLTPREFALLDNYRHIPDKEDQGLVERMASLAARSAREGDQTTGTEKKAVRG